MSKIISIAAFDAPYLISQADAIAFARERFAGGHPDIERLLTLFDNSLIDARRVVRPLEWYRANHSWQERNDLYIELATSYGSDVIAACLASPEFLKHEVSCGDIAAIFFISSTGLATPSIEARIMNRLPFSPHTKRIPIWGLGCAGGAAGIARAHEYCTAFPDAKVLVVAIELCSLTYQQDDLSKSNLVGSALFADGAACVLVVGDRVEAESIATLKSLPAVRGHQTTLMPDSERVMGWDVKDGGLYVVFSRDIPEIIRGWLKANVDEFLSTQNLNGHRVTQFIAHPGGRKVLEAYQDALHFDKNMTAIPRRILQSHGNMSSPSVFYVLQEFMRQEIRAHELGLMAALGPGFTSELLLLEWQ